MNEEILFVIINAVLYSTAFIFALVKNKTLNVGVFVLCIWAISSLSTINFFTSDLSHVFLHKVTLIPFIYLFVLILIFFIPVYQFKSNFLEGISYNRKLCFFLSTFIVLVSIEPFLENFYVAIKGILSGGTQFSESYDQKTDSNYSAAYLSEIGRKLNYITICFKGISPILFFLSLIKTKYKRNYFIIIGLLAASLNPMVSNMNTGGRFGVITELLYFIFLYLIFKNLYTVQLRKKILLYSGVFFSILLFGVVIITYVRFQGLTTELSIWDWISLYLGESFVNFNTEMWYIKRFTKGDNSFFLYEFLLGIYEYPERQYVLLESVTGIRMNVYYTFIGDFFVDMGATLTVFFVTVTSFVFYRILKFKKIMPLYRIILLGMIGKVCVIGFTYYTYLNTQIETIITLVISFLFFVNKNNYGLRITNKNK